MGEVHYLTGVILALIGGIGQGSFLTPMKKMTKWEWENSWVIFAVTAYVIFPFLFAIITIPNLFEIYNAVGAGLIWSQFGYGIIWGVGAVSFGLGTLYLGLALGFAIIMGLSCAMGALIPLLILHPEQIWSPESMAIYLGIIVMLLALVVIAKAGQLKEKELAQHAGDGQNAGERKFGLGLFFCIFAGFVSSLINIIFAFGGAKLGETALQMGVSQSFAGNAFWAVFLPGACITNSGYAIYLLFKNKTWHNYTAPGSGSHWIWGILTGFLFMAGMGFYGMGATNLGALGPSLGWPLMVSSMIISANIWGALTGEWKGISKTPIRYQMVGLILLIIAIIVISAGPSLF